MSGGKIVRIAGGKIITNCENLTYNQDNFTINSGGKIELTTEGEMIFGEPQEPATGGQYIIRGWWSSDKEGENKIKKAYLGDIVYFQIETKDVPVYNIANDEKDPDVSRLHISFYDIQFGWLGLDSISWDRKMEGGPDCAYVTSPNRAYACIKIRCTPYTINMVKEDDSPGDIEIYCKAEYKPGSLKRGLHDGPVYQRADLPISFGDYLRVGLPEIPDLYFIKPDVNYQFPEIRSSEGNAIFMQLLIKQQDYTQERQDKAKEKITGVAKGKLTEKVNKTVEKTLEKLKEYSYTLAVRELEKGMQMYTDGRVVQRLNVYEKDITMIDGNVRAVKRACDTSFRVAHPTIEGETYYATTKGLNQLEVFAQRNPVHTAADFGMKVFETLGFVMDLQGMEQSMATGTPDYKGAGSLLIKKFFGFFPSWVGRLTGTLSIPVSLLVDEYSKQLEELIDEIFWEEFLVRKEKGMKATKDFLDITIPNQNRESILKHRLSFLGISTPTLKKLMAKEFENFKDLDDFNFGNKEEHGIVYRKIYNQDYKRDDYFIYCIFIDEKDLN